MNRAVPFRDRKVKRRLVWLAIVFCIWWVGAWLGAKALIVDNTVPSRAEVIVVMSGSSAYQERTQAAAQMFQQYKRPIVVLTNDGEQGGWSNEKQRNPYTFERATDELVRLGVPRSAIKVLPDVVNGTYEEVEELSGWSEREKVGSILVVTSGYHSRRARWTFNRLFPNSVEVGLLSVPPGNQTPAPATWWLFPSGWRSVGAEYMKLVYYWVRYRS